MTGDFELVEGRLVPVVPPGFEHGDLTVEIASTLKTFVKTRGLGRVVVESGFYLRREPDTVRGPDVAFYPEDRLPQDRRKFSERPPRLAVEVVSPHDSSEEMEARVREFLAAGVEEVWVAYPRTRTLHRHRQGWAEVLTEHDRLRDVPALPGFEHSLAEWFSSL